MANRDGNDNFIDTLHEKHIRAFLIVPIFVIFSLSPSNLRGKGFPGGSVVKNPPANAVDTRDAFLIPGSGRFPGVGNGNPLQYSCLENSMDRRAWWAAVHGVPKSLTQL